MAILDNSGTPELAVGITAEEVRTLIGAGTSSFDGAYGSLSGTPTIPSAPAIEDNSGTPALATGITLKYELPSARVLLVSMAHMDH